MIRRIVGAVAGLGMAFGLAAAPAKADPAVQGIAIAGVLQLLWGIYENPNMPDADREFIAAGVGIFDVADDENQAILYSAEYWAPVTFFRFRPIVGIIGTSDEAIGGYFGLRHDVNVGKHLVVSGVVSAAFADWGNGKDLGSPAVLRSGIEVAYRFDNGAQAVVGFHHMSHGELFGDTNPGTETLTFKLAIPTDALFGGQLLKGKRYWPKLLGW